MSRSRRLRHELRAYAFDALAHPRIIPCKAVAVAVAAALLRPLSPELSLALACRCHRILQAGRGEALRRRLAGVLERAIRRACAPGGLIESVPARPGGATVDLATLYDHAGIVLKAPRIEGEHVVEKGVLLLKNTERIDAFRRRAAMAELLGRYRLVLEPSWSGYADLRLLTFCVFRDHPIVVMAPCRSDHEFLVRLRTNLTPTAIGASDWVDPRVFRPLPQRRKRFDAVMVARWTLLKRHHVLLRALRRIGDRRFRVALVASNVAGDRDRDAIRAMLEAHDRAGRIEIFEDLDAAGVNEVLNESKVNVLLSRQEGSNRALFEGFFAGVPALALARHVGIPTTHFNEQTGRLIDESELPQALLDFREHWSRYDPRPWAMENIAAEVTRARLNTLLEQLARDEAEPWTRDVVGKCNRPELQYYPDDATGRGLATVRELLARRDLDAADLRV